MNKPKVVILGITDWAGSGYNACRAINTVGEFDCRHITLYDHMYEYPIDILVRYFPKPKNEVLENRVLKVSGDNRYGEVVEVLQEADIIHLWNTLPSDLDLMSLGLPIDYRKVRVVTMTGSFYRNQHTQVNALLKKWDNVKLTVQDILFDFSHEINSVFIPHAVDIDFFHPVEKRGKVIGTYKTAYKADIRTSDRDIVKLRDVLRKFSDWRVDLDYSMPWAERMEKLRYCAIFIQDISPYIGVWGRSTLEACAYGIPTLQNYSQQVSLNADGSLGQIPMIQVDADTLETELRKLTEDEPYRKEVGRKSREWVKEHYSYSVVGKMYSGIYQQVMDEI